MRLLPTTGEKNLPKMSQIEFEQVGDLVVGSIQQLMKKEYQFEEIWLPTPFPDGPKSNIFVSKDFYTNTDRCLILILDTGAVRAG